jgi:hypothetical protein
LSIIFPSSEKKAKRDFQEKREINSSVPEKDAGEWCGG